MTLLSYSYLSLSLLLGDIVRSQSFSWVVWVVLHLGVVMLVVVSVALALCRRRLMESEYELECLRDELERVEARVRELKIDEPTQVEIPQQEDESVEVEVVTDDEIVRFYVRSSMTSSDRLFLTRLIQYVELNIDKSDLAVNKLCDFMGVTQLVLNKKLKSLVGMTAIVFIRTIRLRRAAILLRTSRYTVADVTYDVGFSDLRYFRECFKKEFGVLPQEYKAGGE